MKRYTLILVAVLLLQSCNNKSGTNHKKNALEAVNGQPVELDLKIPKIEEGETTVFKDSSTITCILLSSDSIYCYQGNNLKDGDYYAITGENSYRTYIKGLEESAGDSLTVIIKPTLNCSYKTTVDVLDEMMINKIERYAMVGLTKTEKKIFQADNYDWTLPEQVKIAIPGTTKEKDGDGSFIIGIAADGNVSWWVDEKGPDKVNMLIHKVRKEQITKAVIVYRSKNPRGKILIKGDRDSKYPDFEFVTDELKQANELKYELVTEN